MKQWIHQTQGVVTLVITGAEPERFLNACAKAKIRFWGSSPVDAVTLKIKVHAADRRKAEQIGEKLMCDVETERQAGLPFFLRRLRRRVGFLAGMAFSVAAVCFCSQFLLSVEVSGNEQVPTAVILSELRRLGVRPGAFGPGLDEGALAQEALISLDGLSWMAINLHGTRAQVLVREKIPKPELEPSKQPADVVAEATGLVTHLEAWQGKALFEEGDTVVEGDVVISGWMPIEPPPYSGITDLGGRAVRAEGRVEARTWRILQAAVPLEAETKEYTGRETDFYSLIFFGKRLNFYRNSRISYDEYDKITKIQWLTMPGGQTLPIALLSEQVRETELLSLPVETEGAVELLSEELNDRLALLVEDGEVVGREISWEQNGGLLTVRLLAECLEEIGKTVEWPS